VLRIYEIIKGSQHVLDPRTQDAIASLAESGRALRSDGALEKASVKMTKWRFGESL